MMDKDMKFYKTKSIYLGQVTTINPNSYTIEGQFEKKVIAFHQTKNEKNQTIYLPVGGTKEYYIIEELVPIQKKMKKRTMVMTSTEIEKIVRATNKNQLNPQYKEEITNPLIKQQSIARIKEELDINKVKRLVA